MNEKQKEIARLYRALDSLDADQVKSNVDNYGKIRTQFMLELMMLGVNPCGGRREQK